MIIYLGADHGGFNIKEQLKKILKEDAYDVVDMGAAAYDKDDDYPTFAGAVAKQISQDPATRRGIVICRSGIGADVTANKFKGVRSVLAMSPDHVYAGRHDDNVNVLAIAADFIDPDAVSKIVKIFLTTPFEKHEPRYQRRLDEIAELEK
jgi:ribose 5-phosphate isomerase B